MLCVVRKRVDTSFAKYQKRQTNSALVELMPDRPIRSHDDPPSTREDLDTEDEPVLLLAVGL